MDDTDPEITFDENGVCSHCHAYDRRVRAEMSSGQEREEKLARIVAQIKADGHGKEYDCILGVSGGADSSYLAFLAHSLGLRPLAVHFDNGWNSELAVDNIKTILSALEIDLHTYVVDWEEFRDLQLAFLRASVPNAEIPTDHGINAVLWDTANRFGLRYILSGSNLQTEGIMPLAWTYTAMDFMHIRAIHRRFGQRAIPTFPSLGMLKFLYYVFFRRIRVVNLLNLVDYQKEQAVRVLEAELGWRPYAAKHYESVWTRFYQGSFLIDKFGYDKRKPHLSNLVNSGQIDREEALDELMAEEYPPDLRRQDKEFVLKKFGMSETEYEALLRSDRRSHLDYPNLNLVYLRSSRLLNLFKQKARAA